MIFNWLFWKPKQERTLSDVLEELSLEQCSAILYFLEGDEEDLLWKVDMLKTFLKSKVRD
jgi:hypothetical protein